MTLIRYVKVHQSLLTVHHTDSVTQIQRYAAKSNEYYRVTVDISYIATGGSVSSFGVSLTFFYAVHSKEVLFS